MEKEGKNKNKHLDLLQSVLGHPQDQYTITRPIHNLKTLAQIETEISVINFFVREKEK